MEPTAGVYKGEIPCLLHVYAGVCVCELEFHAENHYMERLLREVDFTDTLRTCHVLRTRTHGDTTHKLSRLDFLIRITHPISHIMHYASHAHGDIALGSQRLEGEVIGEFFNSSCMKSKYEG